MSISGSVVATGYAKRRAIGQKRLAVIPLCGTPALPLLYYIHRRLGWSPNTTNLARKLREPSIDLLGFSTRGITQHASSPQSKA
uniref:Uncharacterized protein n=1 Tax=Anguilla anguilla TaxID=7936 RepID=A0A0E9VX12_ANGAN